MKNAASKIIGMTLALAMAGVSFAAQGTPAPASKAATTPAASTASNTAPAASTTKSTAKKHSKSKSTAKPAAITPAK